MIQPIVSLIARKYLFFLSSVNLKFENFKKLEMKIKTYTKYNEKYFSDFGSEIPKREFLAELEDVMLKMHNEILSFFFSLLDSGEIVIDKIVDVREEGFFPKFISQLDSEFVEEKLQALNSKEIKTKEELIKGIQEFLILESKVLLLEKLLVDIDVSKIDFLEFPSASFDLKSEWNSGEVLDLVVSFYILVLKNLNSLKKK